MDEFLSARIRELRSVACDIAEKILQPHAEKVDRECSWPEHSMRALAGAKLMGLHVPMRLGGLEQGLLALTVITEALAKACSSSAICYGMHCVGSAVIAAKATPYQEDRYLRPIAEGKHITTLALSETGTGSHFFFPQTTLAKSGENYVLNGNKQFVTNGARADSYVISTHAEAKGASAGEFSCLILDNDLPNLQWQKPWHGMGMRGNSSLGLLLEDVAIPETNLLGEEGDQIWYVFEVVAPYFLMSMSGTYLGIAQAAYDITQAHVHERQFAHSGERLAHEPVVQHRLAEMWTEVQKTRALVYHAARLCDAGDSNALPALLSCKADVADTAVWVANEAMTLCGGIAYGENSTLAQLLRDARAAHVMSPTTDILKQWTGRALLGLPLL